MEKVVYAVTVGFFVLLELLRRQLSRPIVWLIIALTVLVGWSFSGSGPAVFRRSAPRQIPIIFQADPDGINAINRTVLERAVGRFHLQERRLPKNWEELEAANCIEGMPMPPAGKKFFLSPSKMELTVVDQ